MKKRTFMIIGTSALTILVVASMAFAQGGYGKGMMRQGYDQGPCNGPQGGPGWFQSLTEEQQKAFQTLTDEHRKVMTPLFANLEAKEAQFRALLTDKTPDRKKVQAVIDDIADLQSTITKNRLGFRAQLADKFDMPAGPGFGPGSMMGMGYGRGHGQGMGQRMMGQGMGPGAGRGHGPCFNY